MALYRREVNRATPANSRLLLTHPSFKFSSEITSAARSMISARVFDLSTRLKRSSFRLGHPQPPKRPTWTPGIHTSSSTMQTRIDAKFLPDLRSHQQRGMADWMISYAPGVSYCGTIVDHVRFVFGKVYTLDECHALDRRFHCIIEP